MNGTCALGAAIATFVLAIAAPASGHVAALASGEIGAGPALTNDGAVFAAHGRGGWRVELIGVDGAVRVLHQFDSLVNRRTSYPSVAASPGRIAVSDTRQYCYTEPDGLRDSVCDPVRIEYREGAPAEATSRSLETCNKPAHAAPPRAIDVTDDAVAYIGCNPGDADAVVVRSLSDPTAEPFLIRPPEGQGFDAVLIAGRYVAAELPPRRVNDQIEGPTLVVYDRDARQELYRVGDYSSDQGDFALQDDGTVVVVRGMPGPHPSGDCLAIGAPEYYTPAEPFAHPLSRRACRPGFALAGGRLVYEAFGGARPPRSRLTLAALGGGPELAVAPTSAIGDRTWDLDSTRVTYTDSTCAGDADRVVMSTLEELRTAGAGPDDTCPIRFARKRAVVERRNGVLAVRVACPGGCSADLDVRPLRRRRSPWQYYFTVRAGRVKTVTGIQLYSRQDKPRDVVRRRCAVTVRSFQPDGTEKKVRLIRRLRISKHP